MKHPNENNSFKKMVTNAEMSAKDKEVVLKTIETAKLLMEAFELVTVKHVKTRYKIVGTLGNNDSSDTNDR